MIEDRQRFLPTLRVSMKSGLEGQNNAQTEAEAS
ncbi:Uncharacterised protein [Arachnia propionica]|nr:Uncharacterised protein [Arachnia propionica]